jgi:enoyl-CoA hydratase
MTSGGVRVERSGPVTTVIMNRPEARNAVNGPAAAGLYEAFDEFDKDDSAAVAVLWGDNGTFCAGADLKALAHRMPTRCIAPGPVRWARAGWCCPSR